MLTTWRPDSRTTTRCCSEELMVREIERGRGRGCYGREMSKGKHVGLGNQCGVDSQYWVCWICVKVTVSIEPLVSGTK